MSTPKRKPVTVLFLLVSVFASVPASGTLYIAFRYDDFSADGKGHRATNQLRNQIWQAEQNVDALFAKYSMPYTIAIVPSVENNSSNYTWAAGAVFSPEEDPEKVEFIRNAIRAGRVEVAQHGFSHTNHAGPNHRPGEFRERDYESQLRDIKHGREILLQACGLTDITTFVPPWNGWTEDTAKALKEAGFKVLSADRYYYYKSAKGLIHIPFTAVLHDIEGMLDQGRLPKEGIIAVLYHPFDITIFPAQFESLYFGVERFDKLLQKLSEMPDVKVATLRQLAEEVNNLTAERYHKANTLWRQRSFWEKLLPQQILPGTHRQELYLSLNEYSQILSYWKAATVGLIIGVMAIGLLLRSLLNRLLVSKWRLRADIIATLLFCISIITELRLMQRGYHITGIRAVPALFGASFVIALMSQTLRKQFSAGKTEQLIE